jgi:hypothetical protein
LNAVCYLPLENVVPDRHKGELSVSLAHSQVDARSQHRVITKPQTSNWPASLLPRIQEHTYQLNTIEISSSEGIAGIPWLLATVALMALSPAYQLSCGRALPRSYC